jgi:hypothetical protein
MSSSCHHRLSRGRRRRSRLQWERVHPQKARKTIHTTYDVEDAAEGRTMSGTRSVRPVVMVPPAGYDSMRGLTRRSMELEYADRQVLFIPINRRVLGNFRM